METKEFETAKLSSQENSEMVAVNIDFGGRRKIFDRRSFKTKKHFPERRSGVDRRSGFDRRSVLKMKKRVGKERRKNFSK